eukprot:8325333-Lingulodinium_polyedra.AAC.1
MRRLRNSVYGQTTRAAPARRKTTGALARRAQIRNRSRKSQLLASSPHAGLTTDAHDDRRD